MITCNRFNKLEFWTLEFEHETDLCEDNWEIAVWCISTRTFNWYCTRCARQVSICSNLNSSIWPTLWNLIMIKRQTWIERKWENKLLQLFSFLQLLIPIWHIKLNKQSSLNSFFFLREEDNHSVSIMLIKCCHQFEA